MLPYILLSIPAGVIADRFDRRMVLLVSDLARAVCMVVMAVLVALDGPLVVIAAVAILAACFSTFFYPAIGALVPSLVGDEREFGPANSAWATLDNLAWIVGPGVAGLLLATGDLAAAFLINAVSFTVIAAVLWTLPPSRAAAAASRPRGERRPDAGTGRPPGGEARQGPARHAGGARDATDPRPGRPGVDQPARGRGRDPHGHRHLVHVRRHRHPDRRHRRRRLPRGRRRDRVPERRARGRRHDRRPAVGRPGPATEARARAHRRRVRPRDRDHRARPLERHRRRLRRHRRRIGRQPHPRRQPHDDPAAGGPGRLPRPGQRPAVHDAVGLGVERDPRHPDPRERLRVRDRHGRGRGRGHRRDGRGRAADRRLGRRRPGSRTTPSSVASPGCRCSAASRPHASRARCSGSRRARSRPARSSSARASRRTGSSSSSPAPSRSPRHPRATAGSGISGPWDRTRSSASAGSSRRRRDPRR